MPKNDSLITKAELDIARILAGLETATGQLVQYIGISDLEVTNVGDERPQFRCRVHVHLERLPGRQWDTGKATQ